MTNTSGLGESEQTTTDMLDIVVSSHRDGMDTLMAIARNAIVTAPTCEEVTEGTWSVAEAECFYAADVMKEFFELLVDDLDSKTLTEAVVLTLVHSALSDVDWNGLASSYITRVKENA